MRVRIVESPREKDLEGMELDGLQPGSVRDVSPSVGTWLVVQGYAYPEMRRSEEDDYFTKGRREHRFSGRDRRRS